MGYSFWIASRVLLCTPSHRQDNTYHCICYTNRGALGWNENNSKGSSHEGSIRRPIAPRANALTAELHLAPRLKRRPPRYMTNTSSSKLGGTCDLISNITTVIVTLLRAVLFGRESTNCRLLPDLQRTQHYSTRECSAHHLVQCYVVLAWSISSHHFLKTLNTGSATNNEIITKNTKFDILSGFWGGFLVFICEGEKWRKSSPCGGSGFPLSLTEWSFTIFPTPYNRK